MYVDLFEFLVDSYIIFVYSFTQTNWSNQFNHNKEIF